jgi:hypothetical protein
MTADDATLAVIQALETSGVPYMLAGSFSSNFYGVPRATEDADFVIELGKTPLSAITRNLGPEFRCDPQMSFETVTGTYRNVIQLQGSKFKIELFRLSTAPHDVERFQRRVRVKHLGVDTYLPTVEDVIVTKLNWSVSGRRLKDQEDVRNVIAVQANQIDWDYVYSWCDRHGTRERLDEIRKSIPPI